MVVNFVTPTKISLIDMNSMGDSVKRDDSSSIGAYDSGFKYSIALCLRNDIHLQVRVISDGVLQENYLFDSEVVSCEDTQKEKELIVINTTVKERKIITGFAKGLGYNWELWMLLREIWSNMIDEGGSIALDEPNIENGTIVTLGFREGSEFFNIWNNRHLYINEKQPLHIISPSVEALENKEGYLRIYKQNILVYSDEKLPSIYSYNIKFGEIDERRVLSNIYSVESQIVSDIRYTKNTEYLQSIITKDFKTSENEFLSNQSVYGTCSDLIHDIAANVFEECGEVNSYEWLIGSVKRRPDCRIGGKIIKSIEDSIWSYFTATKVESVPQAYSEPDIEVEDVVYESSFSAEIKKYYNFKLDVEVKIAKLKGSKVIADKHEKCIIIDEDFNLLVDFGAFVIEYIDLTQTGNVVKDLGNYVATLLRR